VPSSISGAARCNTKPAPNGPVARSPTCTSGLSLRKTEKAARWLGLVPTGIGSSGCATVPDSHRFHRVALPSVCRRRFRINIQICGQHRPIGEFGKFLAGGVDARARPHVARREPARALRGHRGGPHCATAHGDPVRSQPGALDRWSRGWSGIRGRPAMDYWLPRMARPAAVVVAAVVLAGHLSIWCQWAGTSLPMAMWAKQLARGSAAVKSYIQPRRFHPRLPKASTRARIPGRPRWTSSNRCRSRPNETVCGSPNVRRLGY
jgi:hypothetical protein